MLTAFIKFGLFVSVKVMGWNKELNFTADEDG